MKNPAPSYPPLDPETRYAGVVGDPVAHSLSPVMHNEWARREDIKTSYEAIRVHPDDFAEQIRQLARRGYAGVNVTLPHKHAALALADRCSDQARIVGAANMLTFREDGIYGDNSDIIGFEKALRAQMIERGSGVKTALVLGAGGASGAVIAGLINCGIKTITITNRTAQKARLLAEKLAPSFKGVEFILCPWDRREAVSAGIVVNTTSLGMKGMEPLEFEIDPGKGHAIIADIVYTPLVTPLLQQAMGMRLRTVDGLLMLMHQGAPGYRAWLGETAVIDADLYARLAMRLCTGAGRKMITIAVTGSIAMGKSTVAKMFADLGCAVWDADASVHRLYGAGGAGVGPVARAFPQALVAGRIDRTKLGAIVHGDSDKLLALEAIIHPLVAADRAEFIERAGNDGARICVLDIPLLFETGAREAFDRVVVVSAPPHIQRARVLARPAMTEEKFAAIMARQMPDAQKRRLADYVITTDVTPDETRGQVARALSDIISQIEASGD